MQSRKNPQALSYRKLWSCVTSTKLFWHVTALQTEPGITSLSCPAFLRMEAGRKAAGQVSCTGGGSIPLLHVFFHQGLRPAFHCKRVRDGQSTVLPLPEQSVPTLLNSCSCVMRKAALPSRWKRYDPANQKTWTLLIYWISARAGIKSPISLDQQSPGFMQSSQSGALQPEPCSSSEEITTLVFLALIYYLHKSLARKIFLLFPKLCQVISRVPWKICVTNLPVCFCP